MTKARTLGSLTIPSGTPVGTSDTQTLTNKTLDGASNTLLVRLANDVTGTLPVANGGTGATSLAANNVILGNGTSAVQVVAPGTSGNVLTSNGTTWASTAPSSAGFTMGTAVATTSGTAVTFTGIPSGIKMLILSLSGVSFTAAVAPLVTIGDSGGLETSGYLTYGGQIYSNSLALTIDDTSAIKLARSPQAASDAFSGSVILTLVDSSTNTWAYSGNVGVSSSEYGCFVGGRKALTATLDRISLSGGTFDAGLVNIMYI